MTLVKIKVYKSGIYERILTCNILVMSFSWFSFQKSWLKHACTFFINTASFTRAVIDKRHTRNYQKHALKSPYPIYLCKSIQIDVWYVVQASALASFKMDIFTRLWAIVSSKIHHFQAFVKLVDVIVTAKSSRYFCSFICFPEIAIKTNIVKCVVTITSWNLDWD